jgi:hypothetical protein
MMASYQTKRLAHPACLAAAMLLSIISAGVAQSNHELTGVVTDRFGAVISNAVITLYSTDGIVRSHTDHKGHFAFTNPPARKYQIEAAAQGFKTTTREIDWTGNEDPLSISLAVGTSDCGSGETGAISYALARPAGNENLTIKVRDFAGRPLPRANLLITRTRAIAKQFSQSTNHNGEFLLSSVEPGEYVLKVSRAGYYDATTRSFWIMRANQTTVVVDLIKRGQIVICE